MEEDEISLGKTNGCNQVEFSHFHSSCASQPRTPQPTHCQNVVNRDTSFNQNSSIFPPINHENLPISLTTGGDKETISSSSPSSTRWLAFGIELFRSKIFSFASSFRYNSAVGGIFWSFASAASMVLLFSCLYVKPWWIRLRRSQRSSDNLICLIKEKDEVG